MSFDVAVVGAGPAGAWAAYLLARAGARVALVDGSHPREKPCGGGLTGRAIALVSAAFGGTALPCVRIRAARFVDEQAPDWCDVPLARTDAASLVVADRRTFDARLLQAACDAGATLVPARVAAISRADLGFVLSSSTGELLRTRLLIGADGANSLVRRSVASPLRRSDLSIATGFYVHATTSDEILIELFADPPGYLWSFPRPDHLAVGICAQADAGVTAAALRERAAGWIRRHRLGSGAQLEPYAWPIPSLGAAALHRAPLHGRDWMLLGDAAGLVDPITREGIFFALQSAAIAARAVAAADIRQYGIGVRREILGELERAARFKAGFFQPRFIALFRDALRESAAVRQVMAELIAGTQPYRGLKRRLLGTCEWGLAWRLLSARLRDTRHGPALAPAGD